MSITDDRGGMEAVMGTTEPRRLTKGWSNATDTLWWLCNGKCWIDNKAIQVGIDGFIFRGDGPYLGACVDCAVSMGVFEPVEQKPVEPACKANIDWCGTLHASDPTDRVGEAGVEVVYGGFWHCSQQCADAAKARQPPAECVNGCTNGAWCGLCRAQPPAKTWKAPVCDLLGSSNLVVSPKSTHHSKVAALPPRALDSSRTMASRESRWKAERYVAPGRWRKS